MTVLGPTWTRIVKAGDADCVVTVGEHALFVRRVDGSEPTEAEHRAALAEALGRAVAEIGVLRAGLEQEAAHRPSDVQEPRP